MSAAVPTRAPRALRPFLVGQYRVLVAAAVASLLGAGLWVVAIVFQVVALGGGPVQVSFVATASSLGLLAFVLLGGVAADRVPRRTILLAVEATKALTVGTVAVLALTDAVQLWHLVVAAFALSVADAFFYPAWSAILPSILPADDLLAANGIEGVVRPLVLQAAGPALAGLLISGWSPGAAFAVHAAAQLLAVAVLLRLAPTPVLREPAAEVTGAVRGVLADLHEGYRYMVRTPWLLATLLYACVLVLLTMGPIEVLLPFAVREQTGGGASSFALVLAMYGVGCAVGAVVTASLPLARRYLTVMVLLWGVGCVPLAAVGVVPQLWLMAGLLFVVGVSFQAASVIWGTLLQRRVPASMLGRVSSLDFFVSLALMPVSMAVAGPVGEHIGIAPAFAVAGLAPTLLAVITIVAARMPADEIANPLDPARPR